MRFDDVQRLNRNGMTLKDIATVYGVDWTTVRRLYLSRGEVWFSRQDFERRVRLDLAGRALRLVREMGLSSTRAARTLGVSRRRLLRSLVEAGAEDERA